MGSVKLYASSISKCANKLVGHDTDIMDTHSMGKKGMIAGCVSSPTLTFYFLNPLYHLSGFAAMLAEQFVDYYSTYKCCVQFENKKFSEYGLGSFYMESNIFMSEHPTIKELTANILPDFIYLLIGAVCPPLAYGLLATSYDLYKNNLTASKRIEKAIELGDKVKEKIDSGIPEEDIREWLKDLAEIKR